jgi:tungstate transport system permease protein
MSSVWVDAFGLIFQGDFALSQIVSRSLLVSGAATLIALALGLPLGAWVALTRSRTRAAWVVVLNTCMGLPPVVIGLAVYLVLSRSGPLGSLGWLFTAQAMILAQVVLITPIIAALTRQVIEDAHAQYHEWFASLRLSTMQSVKALIVDCRLSLLTVALAGFGRAIAEVGAVMIVGGNIDGFTRVMTTAIALETSKGDLPLALALGAVLLIIVLALNALAYGVRIYAGRHLG